MATKTKSRNSIQYSWSANIYQAPEYAGRSTAQGLSSHVSPPWPAFPGATVRFRAEGAQYGSSLMMEATTDQSGVSPWQMVASELFEQPDAELECTVPERLGGEYGYAPTFVRFSYSAHTPVTLVQDRYGQPTPLVATLDPHTVQLSISIEEQN